MNKARVRSVKIIIDNGISNVNIFDVKKTKDIPDEVLKNIDKCGPTFSECVLMLFDIKNELTISEIIVASWRKFNIVLTRPKVQLYLAHLKAMGKIERVSKGVFIKKLEVD